MPRLIAFLVAACAFAAPAGANDKPDCSGAAQLTLEPILVEVVDFDRNGGYDDDIDGNNPRISIKLRGRVNPGVPDKADDDRLDIAVQVVIREATPDHTTFSGTGGASVRLDRVLAYGCGAKAESVGGTLEADGGRDNHAWTSYQNGRGLIASASCLSDTKGADTDQLACRVSLHPVPLPQQPLANYQPPVCGQTDVVVALPPLELFDVLLVDELAELVEVVERLRPVGRARRLRRLELFQIGAHDRRRAVAQRVHLVEPAGFESRRHHHSQQHGVRYSRRPPTMDQ